VVTEQSIRAALEHLAARAPDPERIRAGLQHRARVHRQRRVLLAAGGVAAAAGVVGVPSVVLLRRSPELSPAGAAPVPLRYRPAWLPADFGEFHRMVSVRGGRVVGESRGWRPSAALRQRRGYPVFAGISLALRPEPVDLSNRTAPVMVSGVEGGLFHLGDTRDGYAHYSVSWPRDDGAHFSVSAQGIDDSDEVALQVAQSVTPDADAVVEPPVEPGWLPAQVSADSYGLSVFEAGYGVEASLSLAGGGPALSFHLGGIWGGPVVRPEQRRTVTVRDTSVLLYLAEHSWSAHIVLDDGRNLVIDAGQGISDEDLLRVWEQLRVLPLPDTSWMG
jgi:hypothetical protein